MAKTIVTPVTEKSLKLRSLLFQFDASCEKEKLQLLDELSKEKYNAQLLLQFHHLLLGMMAYPGSEVLLNATNKAMNLLLQQIEKSAALQNKFTGTGYLHTKVECNFSYAKVIYLTKKFPGQVSIHSASSTVDTQKSILKLLLPYVEYSKIHEGEKDLKSRIDFFHLSKQQTDLEWLLQCMEQCALDKKTKSVIYNQLGIFIQYTVKEVKSSVSFLRGPSLPIYYHARPLDKKTDLKNIISKKLPQPVKLNVKEKEAIIDAAKLSLFYLYRETEPFTHANKNDLTLFQLDNGISIALFGSKPERRYSLESYIGYMVFKNNIPVSYGGGWIFGERSQFGINILESFRGGESALIICELLRVYHQYYGARRFVVKPYQFGLHNMEAIKTGAFWFYYKLGFRPEDESLRALALNEEKQKQLNPSYKSDISTLKKYTKSNLALALTNAAYPNYDSELLSQRITTYINTQFDGNRKKALEQCFKQLKTKLNIDTKTWKAEEIDYAKQIAVLLCTKPNDNIWHIKHKKDLEQFIRLKFAETELPWIKHLQKFKAFWDFNR